MKTLNDFIKHIGKEKPLIKKAIYNSSTGITTIIFDTLFEYKGEMTKENFKKLSSLKNISQVVDLFKGLTQEQKNDVVNLYNGFTILNEKYAYIGEHFHETSKEFKIYLSKAAIDAYEKGLTAEVHLSTKDTNTKTTK